MIKFDKNSGLLTIQQMEVKKLEPNLINDYRKSYERYLLSPSGVGDSYSAKNIREDFRYIVENLLSTPERKLQCRIQVHDLVERRQATMTQEPNLYYPVKMAFKYEQNGLWSDWLPATQEGMEVFKLPFMDDTGKLNFNRTLKVCLGALKPSEDISFDLTTKDNKPVGNYNIMMPGANVAIESRDNAGKLDINLIKHKSTSSTAKKTDMAKVIQGMMFIEGDHTRLYDVCTSTYSRNALEIGEYTSPVNLSELPDVQGFANMFMNTMYNLGNARNALNEQYNMTQAIGCRLSRSVVADGEELYPIDTFITSDVLKDIRKHCINCIYVYDFSTKLDSFEAADTITISKFPKGMHVGAVMREKFPQYADYEYLPEDIVQDSSGLHLFEGDQLTTEIRELLIDLGINGLYCYTGSKKSGSKKKYYVSFEREIVGNYMVKAGELYDVVPEHMSYDDWIYTFDNPAFATTPAEVMNRLNSHDLEAIYCDICNIHATGCSDNLLNRDEAFLKRLALVDDQFSTALRIVARNVLAGSNIRETVDHLIEGDAKIFFYICSKWEQYMNEHNITATPDMINPAAELCQINHANITVKEAPDLMRRIAMPYYGRICPFETPASNKLGLVNTKAIGARVNSEGILEVPYYKITTTSSGLKINKTVVWLTPKQELHNRFVDLFNLKLIDHGNYYEVLDGYALARIPNPEYGEPFIVSRISTDDMVPFEIKIGTSKKWTYTYVNVYPEQMLSPTACLIPFLSSTDATRISYGLSQIKQAIPLLDSEAPIVQTSMCRDMYNTWWKYDSKAESDGNVCYIGHESMSLTDKSVELVDGMPVNINAESGEDPYAFEGSTDVVYNNIIPDDIVLLNGIRSRYVNTKYIGDKVSKGDRVNTINMDYNTFVSRSPIDGIVTRITDCFIEVTPERAIDANGDAIIANGFTPTMVHFYNGRFHSISPVISTVDVHEGQHVKRGDVLVSTNMSLKGVYSPSRNSLIAYIPMGYNHEDGVVVTETCSQNYTSLHTHHVDADVTKYSSSYRAYPGDMHDYSNHYIEHGDMVGYLTVVNGTGGNTKHQVPLYSYDKKARGIIYNMESIDEDNKNKYLRFHMMSYNKLQEGDKMAGRQGNKGVVSRIYKNSEVPQFMNGMIPDVILNPHGVPSRMNIGQMYEANLGFVATLFNTTINSDPFNGATYTEVQALVHLAYLVANNDYESAVQLKAAISADAELAALGLPDEFIEHIYNNREYALEWRGAFNRDGTAKMYDPKTDTYLNVPVSFGVSYYNKLEQEAESKDTVRGGPIDNNYTITSSQPLQSSTSSQGQRLAEMELVTLDAYGAKNVLSEVLNEKCDNLNKSFNLHAQQLRLNTIPVPDKYCNPRSLENLISYLMGMGVRLELSDDIIDPNAFDGGKYGYDLTDVIKQQYDNSSNTTLKFEANTIDSMAMNFLDF